MQEISKRKILFLVQVPPPTHGSNIINKLVLESKVINETYSTKHISMQFAKNINDVGTISFWKIVKMIRTFFSLIKELLVFKPDLVYFTIAPVGAPFYRDVLYVSIIKIFKKELLFHLHGNGILENGKLNINRNLYKFIFRNTHIICLSELLTSDIRDVYSGKPYIVNNGIELILSDEDINKQKTSKNTDIVKLLYVSNLDKSKGVLDLIEALKILKGKNKKFQLNIIGSSSSNLSIETLNEIVNESGLSELVNILGPVYGEKKYSYFIDSDVFIFPSYYANEAFPLVILEAMQCSLPVISTLHGGIPDIVDNGITGFLIHKNDVVTLEKKIEYLLDDSELRKRMGEAGRKKFINKYSLDIFDQNMKNVIDDVFIRF